MERPGEDTMTQSAAPDESTPSWNFDWRDEQHRDAFLEHLLPTLLHRPGQPEDVFDPGFIDEISAVSDDFRDVRVTVQVNGIEVDAERFLRRYVESFEGSVESAARRLIEDADTFLGIQDALTELVENVERARRDIVQSVIEKGLA